VVSSSCKEKDTSVIRLSRGRTNTTTFHFDMFLDELLKKNNRKRERERRGGEGGREKRLDLIHATSIPHVFNTSLKKTGEGTPSCFLSVPSDSVR